MAGLLPSHQIHLQRHGRWLPVRAATASIRRRRLRLWAAADCEGPMAEGDAWYCWQGYLSGAHCQYVWQCWARQGWVARRRPQRHIAAACKHTLGALHPHPHLERFAGGVKDALHSAADGAAPEGRVLQGV